MKTKYFIIASAVAWLLLASSASAQTISSFGLSPSSDGGIDFNWATNGGDPTTIAATCNPNISISTHEDTFECGDIGEKAMLPTGTYHLHFKNTSPNRIDVVMVLSVFKNNMRVDTRMISVAVQPEVEKLFKFTFPISGSYLVGGTNYDVTWVNDNAGAYGYSAYLGTGVDYNGSNLETIIRDLGPVSGNSQNKFSWSIPLYITSKSDYRIEFRAPGGGGGVSEPFSIIQPTHTNPPSSTLGPCSISNPCTNMPYNPPFALSPSVPTPTQPITDAERQAMIAQIQALLAQLIQQLIALLNSTR